jgi:hypothetical protein
MAEIRSSVSGETSRLYKEENLLSFSMLSLYFPPYYDILDDTRVEQG